MRVVLLNTYYSLSSDAYVFYRASIPYNLLYISAYLKKHGVVSRIYELGILDEKECIDDGLKIRCGISDEEILKILETEKPMIVGISSIFTIFHDDVIELTKLIHSFNPLIRVVAGGNHASCFPEKLLKEGVDQVVVGEGEEAFLSICNGNTDRIIKMPLIENLDEVPFPLMNKIAFHAYSNVHNPFIMRTPVTGVITSRGCPNNCIYCTVGGVWGRSWRGRSAKNVVAEIEYNMRFYGIREFHFLDDNVSVNKKRFEEILDLMITKRLDVKWATPMAYWTIDEKILDKMKAAGCYRLSFGIESGDPETREFIGKKYSLEKAKQIISYANKIGLWTISTNIIGFPYETKEQIQATVNFAKQSGVDFACFFNLIPHVSSRIYPIYIKENLIKETDNIMSIMNEGGCDSVHFNKEELKQMQKEAYSEFVRHKVVYYLTHPQAIIRKIHSVEDLLYVWRLAKLGFAMVLRSISNKVSSTSKDFIYGKRQYVK